MFLTFLKIDVWYYSMISKNSNRKTRSFVNGLLVLFFCFSQWGSLENVFAAPPSDSSPFETILLPEEALNSPTLHFPEKSLKLKSTKLDSNLQSLTQVKDHSVQDLILKTPNLRFSDGRVQVQIQAAGRAIEQVEQAIQKLGGKVSITHQSYGLIQAWLPIKVLEQLSDHPDIYNIRTPDRIVLSDVDTGSYTTEALSVINANTWHSAGYTGAGVRVGVIDAGFDGYLGLRGTDLPSTVVAMNFVDGETSLLIDATTVHGTACAEVIHDIAPAASLYLAKISTYPELLEAVAWLRDTIKVDIISTSFGFYNITPGDGTGAFENLVKSARDSGILWITSAGNDQQVHWGGTFSDTDGDAIHQFDAGVVSKDILDGEEINYFGNGLGSGYVFPAGFLIQIFLRWDDWFYVNQDFDLYLVRYLGDGDWIIEDASTNYQDGGIGQKPTEWIYINAPYEGIYGYVIVRDSATRAVNLEVSSPGMVGLNYRLNVRSLSNLADSYSAMTVGALDVVYSYALETYSSQGPTNGPGGTATGGFTKPNIAGYANVSTVSYGSGTYKFNGTSAATPHVTGAAALVKGAYPFFSPPTLQNYLQLRAIDMGLIGIDNIYGYGRLYLGVPPVFGPLDKFIYLPTIVKE